MPIGRLKKRGLMVKRIVVVVIFLALIACPVAMMHLATAQSVAPSTCGRSLPGDRPVIPPLWDKPSPANGGEIDSVIVGGGLPGRPAAVAFAPDGSLYVAVTYSTAYPLDHFSMLYGSVFQLVGDEARLLLDGLNYPTGLAFLGDDLYVTGLDTILLVEGVVGTSCERVSPVVSNLPFDESHWTNGVTAYEGRIYATTGYVYHPLPSSRVELMGSVFSFAPDGSDLRIEATGLRNSYALAFDEQGGIWATDNGPNVNYDPGIQDEADVYPDELNLIVPGRDYGFHPRRAMPRESATPVAGSTPMVVEPLCVASTCGTPPVTVFDKHTAPTGVAWDSQRSELLLCLSAWGQVLAFDPTSGDQRMLYWGLNVPSGIAIGPDGYLYVAEWGASRVIRLALPDASV
jgi:glucose/arabinose dehydrogenase